MRIARPVSILPRLGLVTIVAALGAAAPACNSDPDAATDAAMDAETATGLTCHGLQLCRSQCKDFACIVICNQMATPAAKDLYERAEACAFEHACKDEACLQQSCHDLIAACDATASADRSQPRAVRTDGAALASMQLAASQNSAGGFR